MIESKNTLTYKKEILEKLSKRQLKDAFELLTKLVVQISDWHSSEKLSELETNYKYLLHYQFEDTVDPQKDTIYNSIIRSLYELTDDATDELLAIDSSNLFFERLRINHIRTPLSLGEIEKGLKDVTESWALTHLLEAGDTKLARERELSVKRERMGIELFNQLFVSPRATATDELAYTALLKEQTIPLREQLLLVSALTLNLFHRFDGRKLCVLMDACLSDQVIIKQRAIVGLIIILQMYDVRWQLYSECQFKLETLSENESFRKSVLTVIKQLIRSRETEEISRKLTDEIIPEMMKFNSLAGKKLNMEDLMGETDFAEKNPDWKKELENSGLANKLQEYSNLQMEGADVFHSTFSSLKNFSFFGELSNWFLPFDTQYSELQALFAEQEGFNQLLQKVVLNSTHMCNSDKYSFALSLLQIPASQRQLMTGRFGDEADQLKEIQKDAQSLNPRVNEEILSNQYIQDLYRFFKLYPYKNNFFDVFKLKLNFYDKKSIAPLISDRVSMLQVANYCFDKNFFAEALAVYCKLTQGGYSESDIWQRMGYCRQMLNDSQGALTDLLQAELLLPDNSWIIKRIAQLYKSLKDPQRALEYYQRAAQLTPNNLNIELNIGHCYLDLGEYDKALNSYFKVELLDTKTTKAWRPIAWTAFLLRKFDLAQQYYQQIITEKPNVHDFLNAGHIELCLNQKKKALDFYLRAADKTTDFNQFVALFDEDTKELVAAGIDASFFSFLLDELRYKMD